MPPEPAAPELAASVPPVLTNGAASSEALPAPGVGSITLREALSRQPTAAAAVVDPTVEPAAAPVPAGPAAESAPPQAVPEPSAAAIADNPDGVDSVEGPPGAEPSPAEPVKSMSLRDALASRAASGESPASVGSPDASVPAAPTIAPTTPATSAGAVPSLSPAASVGGAAGTQTEVLPAVVADAPPPEAGRAISLREALARGGDIIPGARRRPGVERSTTSLRNAPPPPPEGTPAGAVSQLRNIEPVDDQPKKDRPRRTGPRGSGAGRVARAASAPG